VLVVLAKNVCQRLSNMSMNKTYFSLKPNNVGKIVMENSFKNTGNNDENRVGCVKSQTVLYYKTTRHANSFDDSIIASRDRDSISPGDYTSPDPAIQDSTLLVPSFDYFHLNMYKCLVGIYSFFFKNINSPNIYFKQFS